MAFLSNARCMFKEHFIPTVLTNENDIIVGNLQLIFKGLKKKRKLYWTHDFLIPCTIHVIKEHFIPTAEQMKKEIYSVKPYITSIQIDVQSPNLLIINNGALRKIIF